ncbi:MAG: insulinase family protein [Candidatus Omnitrophica bacterium]|nr:insulinase family protein [Candidatus Omnitrophota bacterium]
MTKPLERPAVTRTVLPNGLTLLIQEEHAHPLAAFYAVVRTGSATEGKFLGTGISHVVEHMLFKGTARRPVGAVEKEARSYGGTSQGYTTYDTTSYQLVVNREHWSEAADLLIDALFFPTMDSAEFSKEREVVLRELKMRKDDPGQLAWDLLFSNVFRVHPYRIPIIGYESLLKEITAEETREYHEIHYGPNRMVLAVVGDVSAPEVIRRVEELTAKIHSGRVPETALPEEPETLSPREVTQESDVATLGIAAVGFPGVAASDPDLFALDLLSWILGGGRGSILEKALKETGLVHSVGCWNYTPMQKGLFSATLRMDPERMDAALKAFWRQIDQVIEAPLPSEELAAAKRALLREYVAGRQSVAGLSSDLAGYEVTTGDPLFAYRYLEEIDRIGPAELQAAAGRFLRRERATTVRVFPKDALPGGTAEAGKPAVSARPAVEKLKLANGVRVLLRPDTRLPLVTVHAVFLGGVRYETEQTNGISALLARLMTRGTRRHKAEEITEAFKRWGAELASFSGRNSLGLTLEVGPQQLSESLTLLAELLAEPSFPTEELEKERRLALAALKAQEEDPFAWGIRRLASTLYTQHPYRLDPAGTRESVQSIRREDLAAFHAQVLQPSQWVVSVTGDFKRENVVPLLEDSLGRFKGKESVTLSLKEEPPLKNLRERMEQTSRQEALLLIGFPGLRISDPRVPILDVLEAVLSGGAGRLFSEVREKQGLAYTVGAFAVHGLEPGWFTLYSISDPSQLETVRRTLFEEIQRLAQSSLPAEELRDAKEGLLGERRMARQSQRTMASQLAGDELYGLGFDYSDKLEKRIAAVTAAEIQQVARELLDPQRCVVVVGLPSGSDGKGTRPIVQEEPVGTVH